MKDADAFRDRLRRALDWSPLNYSEIAEAVELDGRSAVSEWVRPGNRGTLKYLPRGESLLRLSQTLDVDYTWLLSGRGDPHDHKRMAIVRHATTAEWQDLNKMLAAIQPISGQDVRRTMGQPPDDDQNGEGLREGEGGK